MPGAAPAGGGGQGQEEGSTGVIWAIAGIFVVFGILWYSFKDQIIASYLALKLWELDALGFFIHSDNLLALKDLIQKSNPAALNFDDMVHIGQYVGSYLRIPFGILMGVLAVVVFFGNSTRTFRTTYSMKILANSEKDNWPQILPVVNLDLVHTDIDQGPWAMAMTPIQFCKKNNLIEEVRRPRQEGSLRRDAGKVDVLLRRGEANKIFAMQIGPRWEGVERLPPYARALFAVFAARINADRDPALKLLLQINRSCATKKLDFTGVDAMIKKHINSTLVKRIMQDHAYVLTVMASMLVGARLDGVQATADFLWLKPMDRRMWYMLNTMGRQTPFVESAGPYAHWLAERESGRKLIVPVVENATNALEIALKSMVYHPDEEK